MGDFPKDGDVFGFRTTPLSDFAPSETNRFGSIKVLGVGSKSIVVAVLDGVFEKMPTLEQVLTCNILRMNRYSFENYEAVFGFAKSWWSNSDLEQMKLLGQTSISSDEMKRAHSHFMNEAGSVIAGLSFASNAVEGEWRWTNDQDLLLEEDEKLSARRIANEKAEKERYENRLKNLTWDQLLSETLLERWTGNSPFPNEVFTAGARRVLRKTILEIQELGDKSKKKDVRAILKSCVTWFNQADETHNGPIETEEREDICRVLEEIAFVARHKSLINEVNAWRDW